MRDLREALQIRADLLVTLSRGQEDAFAFRRQRDYLASAAAGRRVKRLHDVLRHVEDTVERLRMSR